MSKATVATFQLHTALQEKIRDLSAERGGVGLATRVSGKGMAGWPRRTKAVSGDASWCGDRVSAPGPGGSARADGDQGLLSCVCVGTGLRGVPGLWGWWPGGRGQGGSGRQGTAQVPGLRSPPPPAA